MHVAACGASSDRVSLGRWNKGREREVGSFMGALYWLGGSALRRLCFGARFCPRLLVTLRRRDARHRFSWVNTRPLAPSLGVWLAICVYGLSIVAADLDVVMPHTRLHFRNMGWAELVMTADDQGPCCRCTSVARVDFPFCPILREIGIIDDMPGGVPYSYSVGRQDRHVTSQEPDHRSPLPSRAGIRPAQIKRHRKSKSKRPVPSQCEQLRCHSASSD